MPLRTAQARLAVLDSYADRDELGAVHGEASAAFNPERLELLRSAAELEAELSGEPDHVARNEEEKGISLRELERALAAACDASAARWSELRERWFERLLGAGARRAADLRATSRTCAGCRRSTGSTRRSARSRSA